MSVSLSPEETTRPRRFSAFSFLKLTVILLAWVAAFVAFLVAPIIVLIAAWVLGLGLLATRAHSGRGERAAGRSSAPGHRFGGGASGARPGGDA